MELQHNENWQTATGGKLEAEYEIYLLISDDGAGRHVLTGEWLKTFEEWLNAHKAL